MSELAKRIAVAAVGIPAVLALAYFGGWILALPLAAFAAAGARELLRMAEITEAPLLGAAGPVAAATLVLLATWQPTFTVFAPTALGLLAAVAAMGLVVALWAPGPSGRPLEAVAVSLTSAVYVGLALSVVPLLHALPSTRGWGQGASAGVAGLLVLALPLAATWAGDAAAFFAGTAWGKGRARLAPTISPNKSWVGFWASLGGAGLAGVLWWLISAPRLPGLSIGGWGGAGAVGAVLGGLAVLGDLVESLLKRAAGVKDSGTFFPGHGGVLDRLDSLLFTIPAAYLMLAVLGGAS